MNANIIINFELDGRKVSFSTTPDARLLDIIREDAGITAVKEGCGEGECGACSVFLNDRLVNSCCIPAITIDGARVTTIEGFSKTEEFKILSESFTEAGAVQCGFCTPGFIMAAAALLRDNPKPSEEEIKVGLSGNLCRCTGYTMIVDAVKLAAGRIEAERIKTDE